MKTKTTIPKELNKYYPIINKLTRNKIITTKDLKPYFTKKIIKDTITIQKIYQQENKKRGCGNPAYIHPIRTLIWAKATKQNEKTQRLTISHDTIEDHAKTIIQTEQMINKTPEELKKAITKLTNTYKTIIEETKTTKTKTEFNKKIQEIKNKKLKHINIKQLEKHLNKTTKPKEKLQKKYYEYYLKDLTKHATKNDEPEIITTKIIDRIDNTLSDIPTKYQTIKKIYEKNNQLLKITRKTIKKNNEEKQKKLYNTLQKINKKQLTKIITQYKKTEQERGEFYGKQYGKLRKELEKEQEKTNKIKTITT